MKPKTLKSTAALLAAGLFFSGCGLLKRESGSSIRLSGNIEMTQVNVSFKMAGRLVELPLREGMQVKKGDVLARLDRLQLERQRGRDRAAVTTAETLLTQMKTAVEYQRAALASELEMREADLRQAEARLRDLLAGSRKQEIESARAALADARSRDGQAQRDFERAERLYKAEDISTSQYDQFRTRYESSKAGVQQAEDRLALLVEGPRAEEIAAARAIVERARAALKLTEATRLELRRKEQELETRRAEVERAQAQVAVVDAQLEDTVIASPIDAVVLVKSAEPGEVVAAGTVILTLADIEHPWLRGYVNMVDLGRVKLGQKVRITTEAMPGKEYAGRLSFISSESEFTPKQIQTADERVKLVYRVKIDVENLRHELKSNMPADAEILLGTND